MQKLNGPRYSDDDSQEPSKQEDQKRIAALLLQRGIALKDFKFKRTTDENPDNPEEMIAGIKSYATQLLGLSAAVTEAGAAAEEISEKPPLTAMPFAELATLLEPKGINLQQQLDDHVAFMVRRGAVQKQDVEAYRSKFQTIHIQREEIDDIPEGYRHMLFVDNMTSVEAAKKFVSGADINIDSISYLAGFKKVDPKTGKAYKEQAPSGFARLAFTPNITNLTSNLTGEKADDHLKNMRKGKRYLEPMQWFQLFVEDLEAALAAIPDLAKGKTWKDMNRQERQDVLNDIRIDPYLPDANTWTQFPDWRNNAGDVLSLGWRPDSRKVRVGNDLPRHAAPSLGTRPVRG